MDIAEFPALKSLTQTQMDNLRSAWEARRLSAGEAWPTCAPQPWWASSSY
jgi:hypothetical protein